MIAHPGTGRARRSAGPGPGRIQPVAPAQAATRIRGTTGAFVLPSWIFALIQFIPLSLFATYAFWSGPPDDSRWEFAFKLASIAALIQLAIILPQSRPANRLVLAANLYLLLGGLAFLTHQWWYLELYDSLRESAIFVLMLAVGSVTTVASRAGFVGTAGASRRFVIRASVVLLLATAVALVLSVHFRGDRYLAAVWPIVGLAVVQRVLAYRATGFSLRPGAHPV